MKTFDENPHRVRVHRGVRRVLATPEMKLATIFFAVASLSGCAAFEVEPKNREPVALQPDYILIFESEREGKVFFEHFPGEPKDVFHFRGDYDKQ